MRGDDRGRRPLLPYAFGPRYVFRDLLDIRGTVPDEVSPRILPTGEVRAIRPWEYFSEGIIPWAMGTTVPANVGVVSFINLRASGVEYDVVVTLVVCVGAMTFTMRRTATFDATNLLFLWNRDNRYDNMTPNAALGVPGVLVAHSSGGPPAGIQVAKLASGERYTEPFVLRNPTAPGAVDSLLVAGNTVNQGFDINLAGFILPRRNR